MKRRWDSHFSIVLLLLSWSGAYYGVETRELDRIHALQEKNIKNNSSSNIILPGRDHVLLPPQQHGEPQVEPFFDKLLPRNVTAIASQTAFLHCRVFNLGLHTVSWIRQRDLHILTADSFTYTSDHRFTVIQNVSTQTCTHNTHNHVSHEHTSESSIPSHTDWMLEIKYVQSWDGGTYECQISTEPRISMDFYLTVIESRAHILGPAEKYVRKGSTLLLVCQVREAQEEATLFWYHDQHVIDDQQPSHGITLTQSYDTKEGLTGRLYIEHALPRHSGNYSCLPMAADPAHVLVHVINGEHPAAMQRSNAGLRNRPNIWFHIGACSLVQMVYFGLKCASAWTDLFSVVPVPLILPCVSR